MKMWPPFEYWYMASLTHFVVNSFSKLHLKILQRPYDTTSISIPGKATAVAVTEGMCLFRLHKEFFQGSIAVLTIL